VAHVHASSLLPLDNSGAGTPEEIAYRAAAARVADAMTHDVLLAPIESSVIPLPHQIRALSRAVSDGRVRYLLADEVGLGKTIEAGLILKELKLRGMVKRTLVVAPKGLVSQWVSEMNFHFGEDFQLVLPEDLKTLGRVAASNVSRNGDGNGTEESKNTNAWRMFNQVVVPLDSYKPMDRRRGWSTARVNEYNRERFEDLVAAGWDMVIVDEAHRLGGSTDQVARFRFGQGLSEAAPYLLLLSATPHQGKTDAFHRLVSLVDADAFPDPESVTRERVMPYVIRTEKRQAIDADGKPLFKPRKTELAPVSWGEKHGDQQLLYEAVTEYVRQGYNQAVREKRSYIGFLMILMQRLVVSSTRAIRTTLNRRLEALALPQEQLSLFPDYADDEWSDLDGQEQIETLLRSNLKALKNERAEVKILLEATTRCEQRSPDVKAEALLDWIYKLQSEEGDPDLKVLVFTEFVPTQEMLKQFLSDRGFSIVCLNGSMNMEERRQAQEDFAGDARILISTDAGGEGLNLQFCHVVINYDIAWNPMRLEQRIGRVDRIGQPHVVRAVNFVFEGSVEHRVRQVLEQKLAVILEEFGVDKTSDVLDSALAGNIFDDIYMEAILEPEKVENIVENKLNRFKEQAEEAHAGASILGDAGDLRADEAQQLLTHPLPHWVERMTVNYLNAHGGKAERKQKSWTLTWPDGEMLEKVVFSIKESVNNPAAKHLTLEDEKVRNLVGNLPCFSPGQCIPVVSIADLPGAIQGYWSLWRISVESQTWNRKRILSLFLSDNNEVYAPTARHIWDHFIVKTPHVTENLDITESETISNRLRTVAEDQGKQLYETLLREYKNYISREREKHSYAFKARRKAIERIGLPQVQSHRIALLNEEEKCFHEKLEEQMRVFPDMELLVMLRIHGGNCG